MIKEEYCQLIISKRREEVVELKKIQEQLKQVKLSNSILKAHNRRLKRNKATLQEDNQKLRDRIIKEQQEALKLKLRLSSYEVII